MGLFTKPINHREAVLFVEGLRQGVDSVADPFSERIVKTPNKSSALVIEALWMVASILASRPEAQAPAWSARKYARIYKNDSSGSPA
jgi:hypothetical protein